MRRIRLGVNIDHVATLRNARGGAHPDPVAAARIALLAGAHGITAHLREDRRHIRDDDVERLAALCRELGKPLNLEMAVTDEMVAVALRLRPHAVCLVPERREELTTEGGLNVLEGRARIEPVVGALTAAGVRVSLFVDPDVNQLSAASGVGAPVVELHTGAWCEAVRSRASSASSEYLRLQSGAAHAHAMGLEVHAGHGLDYGTARGAAALPHVVELNIGHFLIGEAVMSGLAQAVSAMQSAIGPTVVP